MAVLTKPQKRLRRRRRVRAKIRGSAERPRLSVYRSNRGISAQLIDDDSGRTLTAVNWTEGDLRGMAPMEQAKKAGELIAKRASTPRSRPASSTAAATATTAASRRWPRARGGGLKF